MGSIRNLPSVHIGRPIGAAANTGGNTPTRTSSVSVHKPTVVASLQSSGKFSSLSGTSGQKYKSTLEQIRSGSGDSDGKPGDHMTK